MDARTGRGFTLAETGVCIVAAAAVGILGPVAADGIRIQSGAPRSASNLAALTRGLSSYAADCGYYPPAYVYGSGTSGPGWRPADQTPSSPNPANGYVHWSGMLLDGGYVADPTTFSSPTALRGGAPAANPGPAAADWEPGQLNDFGLPSPAAMPNDRQAKRMAYTANAAIMGRNRLAGPGSPRLNRLVGCDEVRGLNTPVQVADSAVRHPGNTILLTEFLFLTGDGWDSLKVGDVVKSHRPVTPFVGRTAGTQVYSEPLSDISPRFAYPAVEMIKPGASLSAGEIASEQTELNAVARHNPGGRAQFAQVDGSTFLMTVQDSVRLRRWGDRFLSITGRNDVYMK